MPKETFFNLPAEKRARIVELALAEFAERPYGQASISRIVARAGIAKGSFYQYFENKLDLYRYLLLDVVGERKIAFMKGNPSPPGDFFAALEGMLLMGLRFGLHHPKLAALTRSVRHPDAADADLVSLHQELQRLGHAGIRGLLAQAQQSGAVRADVDLDHGADLLLAVTQAGLDNTMLRLTGVDLIELCARPELASQLDQGALHAMIVSLVDLLRRGFGTGVGAPATIDIDAVAETYRRGR